MLDFWKVKTKGECPWVLTAFEISENRLSEFFRRLVFNNFCEVFSLNVRQRFGHCWQFFNLQVSNEFEPSWLKVQKLTGD